MGDSMKSVSDVFEIFSSKLGVQEAFRTLRTNIQFSSIDEPIKTIVLTSALPAEGKTTVALAFGISMADAGKKTLLWEMDCHCPMLGNGLNERPKYNWMNVLCNNISAAEAAVPTKIKNLYFMDVEPQMTHIAEVIGSNKFGALLNEMKKEYDMVIFDTPPLGKFIETAILANRADGTVLVIRPGMVDLKREREVINQLEKANARILGVVFNGVKTAKLDYYHYYKPGRRSKHTKNKSAQQSN
jgi:capsular exopolysaccharide synthesis family protein